ncbi:MAG: hypothetical protein HDT32_05105, partial [Clostridiales bacterium]|nr:hypothetical protein [Clostridiales bacterium]
ADEPIVDEPQPQPTPTFDIVEIIKEWWQLIASIISIILMLIFISKTIGYENKRKQNKKTIDKKYSNFYGITLFGLATATWTMIACVLMGGALLTFVIMLVAKSKCKKSDEELEDAKDEFERNQKDFDNRRRVDENQHRDEQLQMMLMGMLGGGNGQNGSGQSFVYQQPGLGADDIRGIVADTMSNMLPNVTQYLPQEASHSDELIQQLIEQNAQNEERMRQMNEQNEERVRQLTESNERAIEKLVEKLSTQQTTAKEAEREVAATVVSDGTIKELKETIREEIQSQMNAAEEKAEKEKNAEIIKSLIEGQKAIMEKLAEKPTEKVVEREVSRKDYVDDRILKVVTQTEHNDETIRQLLRNQEMLMKQMMEMSAKTTDNSNERLMERMIELTAKSAEKTSVERVVEKPVEKIVEKEVRVEVPVEKIVEVEKVVPMPVEKPAKATKAPAQRLTLDEAYAKLSDKQKKIFDTLKAYALTKDKCKEKKSTYFTVLGQSTVNPLVKLTIKKNTTVAMFKMEDEYFKDIRKNAGSDGTKMKVKETELIVGDNQALSTAKEMIDLREDQIERYNDYLKEQRSMKKK